MICPHCQHDLDIEAMRCPRCGIEFPVTGMGLAMRARTWIFALVALTVVGLMMVTCVIDPLSGEATADKQQQTARQYGALLAAKSPEAQRAIMMILEKQQSTQNALGLQSPAQATGQH